MHDFLSYLHFNFELLEESESVSKCCSEYLYEFSISNDGASKQSTPACPTNKQRGTGLVFKQNLKNGKVSEEATKSEAVLFSIFQEIRRPFRRQNSKKILKVSLQVTRVFKLVCSGTSWGKREDQEKIMIFLLQTSGRTLSLIHI